MFLNKQFYFFVFILFLSSLLNIGYSNEQNSNFPRNEKKENYNNIESTFIEVLLELREKNSMIAKEGNNLKIKIAIYNIYFYLLLTINSILGLILLSFSIYKIIYCFKTKKNNLHSNEGVISNNSISYNLFES